MRGVDGNIAEVKLKQMQTHPVRELFIRFAQTEGRDAASSSEPPRDQVPGKDKAAGFCSLLVTGKWLNTLGKMRRERNPAVAGSWEEAPSGSTVVGR